MVKIQREMRIDFVTEIISFDEDSNSFVFKIEPDPRRYKWKKIKGKKYLYDLMDNARFPISVVKQLVKQMEGQPIYALQQQIGDADTYIQGRLEHIRASLAGVQSKQTFADKSEDFLQSLKTDRLKFAIMSVDIVGSTKLSNTLDPDVYTRVVTTILFELSEVVPKFHGQVLKYTGDGIIAYFPAPSFITKNDLAIDCALTIRGLVHKAINQALIEQDIEPVDIRIGLDSGEAMVVTIGSPESKQHKDIIGEIVSLACKIQSRAGTGGIALGDVTRRNLYTAWRQICEPLDVGADWPYTDEEGKPYAVYRVNPA